ncbi:MAG: hypothetical protein ACJ75H_06290 [Thermoanaerobaculia bacterium]
MQFRELTDRFQLQKILKSTRFGTVLRATDSRTGGTVAVKLITAPSPPLLVAGAPRFEALATALAGLDHPGHSGHPGHPGLPRVFDHGFTTDGAAFLALELLEGRTLDTAAGSPPAQALEWIGQALDALETLAAQGLAHLNLSPDNLFLAAAPQGERVKLLGLGTAVFRPAGAEAAGAGAPENARFLAPEVAAGGPADGRADLYSLALTTCTALGATVGFGDAPVVQLPLAVSFELENDEALRQALERSLRANPAERPALRDFREALRLALGAPAQAAPQAMQAMALPPIASAVEMAPVSEAPPEWLPDPLSSPEETAAEPAEPAEPEGDVLSSVDDEVLNALLAVPPPPPRPVEPEPPPTGAAKVVPFLRKAAPAPAPAPARPGAPAPAPATGLRRPAVLGTAAVVALLLVAVAVWFLRRPEPQTVQAPAALPDLNLPKPPTQPPVARLDEARMLLALGEDAKARRVLRSIPWGEQGLLAAQGCRELAAIEENLALAALERLPVSLAAGLRNGDLETLESAVEAGAGGEAGFAPAVKADYDRARGVVEAYAQARAAAAQGEPLQVLERFAAFAVLLPKASDPDGLRGKAAAAIEAQAEALLREARYADAVARLEPVQRTWPDRPGLAEKIERYRKYDQSEKEQEAILATLPNIERYKKPWDGLQKIKDVEPTPHLAPRFAAARARLEEMLARLDKEPPKLVMRDGFLLEYARGAVVELSFRAQDDYEVKDVKLMARPEKGKYRSLPLEASRAGSYTVEIDPAFHQNGKVDLYVVATDLSGHEAYLGSAEKPLVLNRKQGFERLIR